MSGATPPIKPKNSSEPIQKYEKIGELGVHEFEDLTGKEENLSHKVPPQNLYPEGSIEHQVTPSSVEGGFWSIFESLLAKIFSIFSNLFSFSSSSPQTTGPVDRKSIEELEGVDKKEGTVQRENHIPIWEKQIEDVNQLPPDQKFPHLLRLYDTLEKEIPTFTHFQEQRERVDTMRQNLKNELDRHFLAMKLKMEGLMKKEGKLDSQANTFQEVPIREKLQILQEEHRIKKERAETLIATKEKQIEVQEKKIQNLKKNKEAIQTKIQQQSVQQKEDLKNRSPIMAQEMFQKREELRPSIDLLQQEIPKIRKRQEELIEIKEGKKTNWFGIKIDFTPANESELARIKERLGGFEQEVQDFSSLPSTIKEATDQAQKQINEEYQKEYQILSQQIERHAHEISVAELLLNQATTAKNEAEEVNRELETISQELQKLANALEKA